MLNERQLTLEQIEAHLQNSEIEQYEEGGEFAAAAVNPADLLRRVCGVYRAVKPVLTVVVNFPLIPSSVKNAIRAFMNVLNGLCP